MFASADAALALSHAVDPLLGLAVFVSGDLWLLVALALTCAALGRVRDGGLERFELLGCEFGGNGSKGSRELLVGALAALCGGERERACQKRLRRFAQRARVSGGSP